MVHAFAVWLSAAAPGELKTAKNVIKRVVQLLGTGKPEVREAVSSRTGLLASASVLEAGYSDTSDDVDRSFMQVQHPLHSYAFIYCIIHALPAGFDYLAWTASHLLPMYASRCCLPAMHDSAESPSMVETHACDLPQLQMCSSSSSSSRYPFSILHLYYLQELRGILEAETDSSNKQVILCAVLAAAGKVRGTDAPFLVQVMISDCLGDADACVRATAAMALEGVPLAHLLWSRLQSSSEAECEHLSSDDCTSS